MPSIPFFLQRLSPVRLNFAPSSGQWASIVPTASSIQLLCVVRFPSRQRSRFPGESSCTASTAAYRFFPSYPSALVAAKPQHSSYFNWQASSPYFLPFSAILSLRGSYCRACRPATTQQSTSASGCGFPIKRLSTDGLPSPSACSYGTISSVAKPAQKLKVGSRESFSASS